MSSPATTAVRDQADAATRHARYITDQVADLTATPHRTTRPSPWLAAQLRALGHQLTHRTGALCPHITDTPRLVHAVAWRPGVLTCTHCARAMLTPTPTEDHTCDRCRRTTNRIHSGLITTGPLLFGFGLCTRCAHTTGHLTTPPDPRHR